MIVYHVDRYNCLTEGQVITSNSAFRPCASIEYDLVTKLNLLSVSNHGRQHLDDRIFYSSDPATLEDVVNSNSSCSTAITEYTFELIRQIKYPHMLSRFSSFFALENLDDLSYWPELSSGSISIFEIEIPQKPTKLDAYYLLSGLCFAFDSTYKFHQGFSPSLNFYHAEKYWSGSFSATPKPELLLPLPVTIGKKIFI